MSAARRLFSWTPPAHLGMAAILLITVIGVFGVVWGYLNPPGIEVEDFDAGELSRFAVRRVVAFPEKHLYVVGLEDGRIRAVDGRVASNNCKVDWLPDDPRGAQRNPQGLPGVYRDPCSGALWSFEGNAISGTNEPLRTPQVTVTAGQDGKQHVFVELINASK